MAEIYFKKIQDLLCDSLEQDEGAFEKNICENERSDTKTLVECEELVQEKIISSLAIGEALAPDALEIILGIEESMGEGMSAAFAYLDEVLYARVFDGEKYVFPLPFMLSENADAEGACSILASYATRELLPLVITDVPRDELEFLCSVFPHVDAYAYEDDDDSFFIKVNNECDMLEEVPTVELDGITLCEILDEDKDEYAQLCRDRELNKFWGYDADVDNPDGNPDFYLNTVRREMEDGIALTLAIREGTEFVGEATVYGFDFRGGASIAVRVMKSCHSRGIGSRATRALIEIAKNMGLKTLNTEIFEENESSIKMTSKFMELKKRKNGKLYFTLTL